MKKKYFYLVILSISVMLLPMLVLDFIPCYLSMATEVLSVGAVDPLFCFVLGLYASQNAKIMWSFPLIVALVFLIGFCLLFGGSLTYVKYAAAFAGIGEGAMLLRIGLDRLKSK